jgi:hypothetical protein
MPPPGGLVGQAMAAGWTRRRVCRVLGLDERRARRWQQRAAAGELDDHPPGRALHGLLGTEVHALTFPSRSAGYSRALVGAPCSARPQRHESDAEGS